MRVIVADDKDEVRSALRLLLDHEDQVAEVGEAVDAEGLLEAVKTLAPDLVLVGWELPGMAPASLVAELRNLRAGLRVVVLSGRPEAKAAARSAGVDGFVSKNESPERLIGLLRQGGVAGGSGLTRERETW
ncbi:MAG: response regulator transcription factor [Thermoleophilia bacterium]|nr:response regulator transcription factor [Thermoleophilia bacterium]